MKANHPQRLLRVIGGFLLTRKLIPEVIAAALVQPEQGRREGTSHKASDPETATVRAGTLRAPRRWEQLLVDAAVIGGQNRWKRRLTGLEAKLRLDLEAIDDPDGPEGDRCRRRNGRSGSTRRLRVALGR